MAKPWERYARGIPIGPQDPYQAPKAAADLEGTRVRTQGALQDMALDRQRIELAKRAEERAIQAQSVQRQTQARLAEQARIEREKELAPLRAMSNQIARVRQLYQKGPGRTKSMAGLLDYLPTDANKTFDTAGRGLGALGLSAFRVPGSGSQSDIELRDFIETNRPEASDRDVVITEKVNNLENRLREAYRARGMSYKPANAPKKQAPPKGWKIERLD